MNKVVWVMGESAAGKATLIRYASAHPDCELMRQLGYRGGKIIPVIGDSDRIKMKDTVLELLENETEAIILIKWQAVDSIYGDVLRKLTSETPGIPREIILLSVESDTLYARVQRKPWWNQPNLPHSYYTQARQDEHVLQIKQHAKELSALGFKVSEIDATDGYKLINGVM